MPVKNSNSTARLPSFCINFIPDFSCETNFPRKAMIRDFARFSDENFNSELAQVDWESIFTRTQGNIDTAFSKIYSKLNKLVNKHAPLYGCRIVAIFSIILHSIVYICIQ